MRTSHHELLPLENLMWRVAEVAAVQLSPLGPVAVRIAYVARQLNVVADGLHSGEGFEIIVTVAEVLPGVEVDLKWELREGRPIARLAVRIDLQFFQQWFDQVDVNRRTADAEKGPEAVGAAPVDPWEPWLDALGEELITDLANTLGGRPLTLSAVGRAAAILPRVELRRTSPPAAAHPQDSAPSHGVDSPADRAPTGGPGPGSTGRPRRPEAAPSPAAETDFPANPYPEDEELPPTRGPIRNLETVYAQGHAPATPSAEDPFSTGFFGPPRSNAEPPSAESPPPSIGPDVPPSEPEGPSISDRDGI